MSGYNSVSIFDLNFFVLGSIYCDVADGKVNHL